MITLSIIEFLFFSFLGWLLDSGYRSYDEKRWVNAGYFRVFICPVYGFGGVILIFLFKFLSFLPLWLMIILGTLAMILVEFLAGLFSEKILRVKLWDYSQSKFNYRGHVDLLHSIFWLLLVIFFGQVLFPVIIYLESLMVIPEFVELPAFLLFLLGSIWLTARRDPARFLEIRGKIADLTVEKYKFLYNRIKELQKTTSLERRQYLLREINKLLENTGARLKNLYFKR